MNGFPEVSYYQLEEQTRKKAYATAYERLLLLVQVVDVAGNEGVLWSDIDCLFAELKGEK
jgi:hypothetical protein